MCSAISSSLVLFVGLFSSAQKTTGPESDLATIESFDHRDAAAAKIDDADTLLSLWGR